MAAFYGVIHKENDTYGLSFPDLPGCVTAASSLEELQVMAAEALKLHLEGMEDDGEPIPVPSSYQDVTRVEAASYGVTLICVQDRQKKVRVNISLSEQDLELIDVAASREGVDRSGFLVRAAKKIALGECRF